MTVCVAALAVKNMAIVCVADKALSYGDHIQWDSDSTKIIKLNPSGISVMFSGTEESTSKILAGFIAQADEISTKRIPEIITLCEAQYTQSVQEMVTAKFLTPRLLSGAEYLSAISGGEINDYIRSIAKEIDGFEMDSDFLLCGFDSDRKPFILYLTNPGIVTDMTNTGFHAIGSGWDKAVSGLF